MERHFHEELKKLKNKLLEMSFVVEEAIRKACEAVTERNEKLSQEVIEGDKSVDHMEIEIDDAGHSLFALGQPMAVDLRLMTMILKINTDLERIGDHAVNIAEKNFFILDKMPIDAGRYFGRMMTAVQKMLRDALDSFLKEDVELAQKVLESDDEVDNYNANLYHELGNMMEKNELKPALGMNLLMISHNLERIADLANNIAEDVIYWRQGREVRHRIEKGKNTLP